MKAVILAGGLGTRISEETDYRPKPMIEIGNMPILWHIMKIYHSHGIDEFVICLGYKGFLIKEYFSNYFLHMSDVTFDMRDNSMEIHNNNAEHWKVTLVDTGEETLTGGRLRRVQEYVRGDEAFCFTYGDGVSNINITELIKYHRGHGKLATVTATRPHVRFGSLQLDENDVVESFQEKVDLKQRWINGGFFVLSPKVIERIEGDDVTWEGVPLEGLATDGELMAYRHDGFWHPMDTLREKRLLDKLWAEDKAPWKTW